MGKYKTEFVCENCGHIESKWAGRCNNCGSWNSFVEQEIQPVGKSVKKQIDKMGSVNEVKALSAIVVENEERISSGIEELDRVLGGGLVSGASILIGGEPGIGKSTLMMQLANSVGKVGHSILYVSGEESQKQLKLRAIRLDSDGNNINLFCEARLEKILAVIEKEKPTLIIIDSIQTILSLEIGGVTGTVTQIKYCAYELIDKCKNSGATIFFTAHVTKDGQIAGPKILEHMVDTVLYFEQGEGDLRIVRSSKNRFGASDESSFFLMAQNGLKEVKDPSALFVTQRNGLFPDGITTTAVYEGSRSFAVEIQALTTPAKGSISRIFCDKIEQQRVSRIAAVIEKIMQLRFSDQDIYINVAGGIRLTDPCVDLAIAAVLYSAKCGVALDGKTLFCGEITLAGELRSITHLERRIKAASLAGFKRIVIPKGDYSVANNEIEVFSFSSVKEVIQCAMKRG